MTKTQKKMQICQKYAQNILTGRFKTPLSAPVRAHKPFLYFEVKVYTFLGIVIEIENLSHFLL